MKKIAHIIGARPHFMKLAPVYEALSAVEKNDVKQVSQVIVHSGQHYDHAMSQQFLEEFHLPTPKYNLDVRSWSQISQLGRIMLQLEKVLIDEKPDLVLVYGDTNTTASGAIAAAKMNIPVGHVEAGLREFDMSIPEEVNKRLIDSVSSLFFCPTLTAIQNLKNEGTTENVIYTGDVVAAFIKNHPEKIASNQPILEAHNVTTDQYHFVTCHRAVNTDKKENLEGILNALAALDAPVLFPIHPRTRKSIDTFELNHLIDTTQIILLEPIGFWETQALIKNARFVLTDSGGVIRESYLHKTPCIILDSQTEWVEAIQAGWAKVAGPDKDVILKEIETFEKPMEHPTIFYQPDGMAALVDKILTHQRK